MSLAELTPGSKAIICAISEKNPLVNRLYELGFLPGETVILEKRAPLGDPLEVTILNYQICLRTSEASYIEVRPL